MTLEGKCGPMASGKSEEIFRELVVQELGERKVGREVLLFTYAGDDRFGVGKITSRAYGDRQVDAIPVSTYRDILLYLNEYEYLDKLETIIVEEASFLEDKPDDLVDILQGLDQELGLDIKLYFLDTDYRDHPIGNAGTLLAILKGRVTHLTAVCREKIDGETCGQPAEYTSRFKEDGTPEDYTAPTKVMGHRQYSPKCKIHRQRPGKPTLKDFGFNPKQK